MIGLGLRVISALNKAALGENPLGILYFHRVLDKPDPYYPDDFCKHQFDSLIASLAKNFNVVTLSDGIKLQQEEKLPRLSVAITFDDGYLDNFTNGLPTLEKYGVKATFFIATEGTETGLLWNNKVEWSIRHACHKHLSIPELGTTVDLSNQSQKIKASTNLVSKLKFLANEQRDMLAEIIVKELAPNGILSRQMMTKEQLVTLTKLGHEVGAHTHSHSILGCQSQHVATTEMTRSVEYLSAILERQITLFAYPNGLEGRDFDQSHASILQGLGISSAFSTNDGGVKSTSDRFALPRFMPYRRQPRRFLLSVAKIMGE